MNALLVRFLLRLALPVVAMGGVVAMAEPLPQPAPTPASITLLGEELRSTADLVRHETARMRQESRQAAGHARTSAAAMRWLITLPAASASGRRCLVDSCTE